MTKGQKADTDLIVSGGQAYKGSAKEIVTLSLMLAEKASEMDKSVFNILRDRMGINTKTFSKLKVIGERMSEISDTKRREVIKQLPASYSTIYLLCSSLTPEELISASKAKSITPQISLRKAKDYIQQVRFPKAAATDSERGRWGLKQKHLYSVMRPEDASISEEVKQSLEAALRRVCRDYGVSLQMPKSSETARLIQDERKTKGMFWKSILQKELTARWFNKMPDLTKKQFNLKNVGELYEALLRTFTGFIIRAEGGTDIFWDKHGEAFVAKLQMLSEVDDNAAQRYNYRRRLEQVMERHTKLAIFNNVTLKNGGFV